MPRRGKTDSRHIPGGVSVPILCPLQSPANVYSKTKPVRICNVSHGLFESGPDALSRVLLHLLAFRL